MPLSIHHCSDGPGGNRECAIVKELNPSSEIAGAFQSLVYVAERSRLWIAGLMCPSVATSSCFDTLRAGPADSDI